MKVHGRGKQSNSKANFTRLQIRADNIGKVQRDRQHERRTFAAREENWAENY